MCELRSLIYRLVLSKTVTVACSQVRSQGGAVLHWGGAVLEAGENLKRSWPRFWLLFTQIVSPFLSKFRWSPKKKRSSSRLNPVFVLYITLGTEPTLIAKTVGGAIFVFTAKIGLKSAKNRLFCILFKAMRGLEPPALPSYATASS